MQRAHRISALRALARRYCVHKQLILRSRLFPCFLKTLLECGDVLGGEVGVCHEGELAVAGLVGFDIVDEVAGDVVEPEIVGDVDGFGAEDGDLDGLAEITAAGHFRSGCLGRAVCRGMGMWWLFMCTE